VAVFKYTVLQYVLLEVSKHAEYIVYAIIFLQIYDEVPYLQFINFFFNMCEFMQLIAFCVVTFIYFTLSFTSTFCVFSQSVILQFLSQIYIMTKSKTDLVQ